MGFGVSRFWFTFIVSFFCFYGPVGGVCGYGGAWAVDVGSEFGVIVSQRGLATKTFTRDVNITRTAVSRVLNPHGGCPDARIVLQLRRQCGSVGLR